MSEYDISQAFEEIEKELIDSMMKNFSRHRAEETKEGYNWAQWQAEQLKSLEQYRKNNSKKFNKQFSELNGKVEEMLKTARADGNAEQEAKILQAVKDGFKLPDKPSETSTAEFFKVNDRKLDALIKSTTDDLKSAETAVLRMSNDKYRSAIFNAQVYANSGAGTYEKAVDMACRDMLRAGLNCVEYKNGARHTLSDYAEMAIRTANKRAYLRGEGEKRQEFGITTVVVNSRQGGCPDCAQYIGRVFIDDVYSGGSAKDGDYPLLSEAISGGLFHPRCKDSTSTYYEDITTLKPAMEDEIDDMKRQETLEQQKSYCENQAKKCGRISEYSLDSDNKRAYAKRAEVWKDKAEKTAEKLDETVAKSTESGTISKTRQTLESAGVEYRQIETHKTALSESEIIDRLGGGDLTKGSCSSLAFAYAGNTGGFDVLDFRDGFSRSTFAHKGTIDEIANLPGVNGIVIKDYNDFAAVNKLLGMVEESKEYYLGTGKHSAIIRKIENNFEYLELQSPTDNGFKPLTKEVLKKRFGCKKSHIILGSKTQMSNQLIECKSLSESSEFQKLLGYINTSIRNQKKGANGCVK